MRTANNAWPHEHIEALRGYMAEDAGTHARIAVLMNERFGSSYSRNAIIGKSLRLKIPSNNPTKARRTVSVSKPDRAAPIPQKPRIPSPNSPQAVALRCVEVVPRNLALVDLQPSDCRWPYGDGPFTFCGHPALTEKPPYCGPHLYLSMRNRSMENG